MPSTTRELIEKRDQIFLQLDGENNAEKNKEKGKTIDSREVAGMMGKQHKDLLDYINGKTDKNGNVIIVGIKEVLEKEGLPFNNYFIESSYKSDGAKRSYQCYLCTKMGCELLGNKQQGAKGVLFTAKYVKRFNDMEEELKQPKLPQNPMQILELMFQVDKEQDRKIETVEKKVDELEENLPLLGIDCDELTKEVRKVGVKCLGYDTLAYKDKTLRGKVYSDIYGQMKREFGVNSYKALKRKQLDMAIDFIKGYELPMILADEIKAVNSQIPMEV